MLNESTFGDTKLLVPRSVGDLPMIVSLPCVIVMMIPTVQFKCPFFCVLSFSSPITPSQSNSARGAVASELGSSLPTTEKQERAVPEKPMRITVFRLFRSSSPANYSLGPDPTFGQGELTFTYTTEELLDVRPWSAQEPT